MRTLHEVKRDPYSKNNAQIAQDGNKPEAQCRTLFLLSTLERVELLERDALLPRPLRRAEEIRRESLDEWMKLPVRSTAKRRRLLDRLLRRDPPELAPRKLALNFQLAAKPPKPPALPAACRAIMSAPG